MALPSQLALHITTPERSLVELNVDEVQVPGSDGYLGVLPGHTPLLANLNIGHIWYRIGSVYYTHLRANETSQYIL